ncbi:MAG TPA: hypothetical protein VN776_03630 [Terracidiphilus sp.]|nr:hypothetical protein [Terracidiphilus sp.]
MGISPITNLTPLPVARAIQADLDPLPMERVENSARTGDETYSPSGGKSARGSEDDASEDDAEQFDDKAGSGPAAPSSESTHPRPISFFA